MQHKYKSLIVSTFLFFMLFALQNANSQCKTFVRQNCIPKLHPYIHDGSYQAVVMHEGEEAEVYKTIFAGQKYRLFVCADKFLSTIEFVVSDNRRNILFDNRKNNNAKHWDFKPEASQQIKITIKIPKSKKQSDDDEIIFECVGILFGLLEQ